MPSILHYLNTLLNVTHAIKPESPAQSLQCGPLRPISADLARSPAAAPVARKRAVRLVQLASALGSAQKGTPAGTLSSLVQGNPAQGSTPAAQGQPSQSTSSSMGPSTTGVSSGLISPGVEELLAAVPEVLG